LFAGGGLEGVPTPVLTLDQIEAWLEKQKKHPEGTGQLTINYFVDALLAQVQAWKETDMSEQWLPSASDQEHWSKEGELLAGDPTSMLENKEE